MIVKLDDIIKIIDPALFDDSISDVMDEALIPERYDNAEAVAKKVLALFGKSTLNTQHGGDHYKKLGDYQPWLVLKNWLTPEEFRGYMKGAAIAYLAREKDKGGNLDIEKAIHTLQALLELEK